MADLTVDIAGRPYRFAISCEKSVVKGLCVTAVTLYGICTGSQKELLKYYLFILHDED